MTKDQSGSSDVASVEATAPLTTMQRAKAFDLDMMDEAALRLSHMGAVELGNQVMSASVLIADLRDELAEARKAMRPFSEFAARIPDAVPNAVNVHAAFQTPWADKAFATVREFRQTAAIAKALGGDA